MGFTFLLSLVDEIVALFQRLDFPRNGFGDVFTCDDAQPIPNMGFEPGVVEFQRPITGQLSVTAANRLLKCREDLVKVIASLRNLPIVFRFGLGGGNRRTAPQLFVIVSFEVVHSYSVLPGLSATGCPLTA